jgi:N-acetylglutamate synthase-like GNAT family acetyltransferase
MHGLAIRPVSFDAPAGALLAAGNLPAADLDAGTPVELFALGQEGAPTGLAGLELLGRCGLLRSLVVAPGAREGGLGRRLVAHVERRALGAGLAELWLLTTTAADYFARLGYERMARDAAPAVVARSGQFASLCPASAVLMRKRLPAAPAPLALAWEIAPALAGLGFGIGASVLLHRLGIEAAPEDLDLVCTAADFDEIVRRLEARFARRPRPAHPAYRSAGFAQFEAAGGVHVEVMADIEVIARGTTTRWSLDPSRLAWSGGLPWMDPRDWLELYRLFDRPARVAQLESFLRGPTATDASAAEMPGLRVAGYAPAFRGWFEALNREWLERWFAVEDIDRRYFADPEGTILAPGGAVFMALDDGRPVGTAAAIPHDGGTFELAKMAVTPGAQDRGVGAMLVEAVLGFAARRRARAVILLSDSKLQPAIRLYERHGFRRGPRPADTGYARGDVFMVRSLET